MNQKKLIQKINDAAKKIHEANMKGGSDYIITSSEVAEAFLWIEKMELRKKKLERILNGKT
jgi:uncharacterized protein YfdQ (DUF2303 family)